jgi:hypothetical protein
MQSHLDCALFFNPKCPQFCNPAMRKLVGIGHVPGDSMSHFLGTDQEKAAELCAACSSFVLK